MIGDTEAVPIPSYPGTWTQFMASGGTSGPTPPLVAAYADGYLFAADRLGHEPGVRRRDLRSRSAGAPRRAPPMGIRTARR